MKKLLPVFLGFMLLFFSFASAELDLLAEYKFISIGDYGFPIKVLFDKIGYLDLPRNEREEPLFTEDAKCFLVEYQKENNLEPSGLFDIQTVESILGARTTDENKELVWIAMHGGVKYHTLFDCWNLKEPRAMSIECAELMEYTHCKICYKRSLETPPLR